MTLAGRIGAKYPSHFAEHQASFVDFEVGVTQVNSFLDQIQKPDYIINCIGITKSHIDESSARSILSAVQVNTVFPNELSVWAEDSSTRIIQIATDCVFSGREGSYSETSMHDAEDVYGKTKSLGETVSENVMHLRCSTIGPEVGKSTLLLEWVRNQPIGAKINGFEDHIWNGITTKSFAKVARGIVENDLFKAGVHHLVPQDHVNKDQLLRMISKVYGRTDIEIVPIYSAKAVDRSLKTNQLVFNKVLWEYGGYSEAPRIIDLLQELVE